MKAITFTRHAEERITERMILRSLVLETIAKREAVEEREDGLKRIWKSVTPKHRIGVVVAETANEISVVTVFVRISK